MKKIDRREFIGVTVAGASALSVVGCGTETRLDPALVAAVSDAVLPDEIGAAGVEQTTADFVRWIGGYSPGAELNHAYGSGDLNFAGDLPVERWIQQLEQLDTLARQQISTGFIDASRGDRRELVRGVLNEDEDAALGNPTRAPHIAIGILSFFYRSPHALDLAYRASIKRRQCRPLADSPNKPLSLG